MRCTSARGGCDRARHTGRHPAPLPCSRHARAIAHTAARSGVSGGRPLGRRGPTARLFQRRTVRPLTWSIRAITAPSPRTLPMRRDVAHALSHQRVESCASSSRHRSPGPLACGRRSSPVATCPPPSSGSETTARAAGRRCPVASSAGRSAAWPRRVRAASSRAPGAAARGRSRGPSVSRSALPVARLREQPAHHPRHRHLAHLPYAQRCHAQFLRRLGLARHRHPVLQHHRRPAGGRAPAARRSPLPRAPASAPARAAPS